MSLLSTEKLSRRWLANQKEAVVFLANQEQRPKTVKALGTRLRLIKSLQSSPSITDLFLSFSLVITTSLI